MTARSVSRASLMGQLEELWGNIDHLVGQLEPSDWSRPHGQHWSFADVPYHLSYFDYDLVAYPLQRGPDLAPAEQWAMRSMPELNAWNGQKFSQRRAGQTPAESIDQMQASREAVRRAAASLSDADLDRRTWFPLLMATWLPARVILAVCRTHTWEHATELRLRMGLPSPVPSAEVTHGFLGDFIGFFPLFLNQEEAGQRRFTAVMDFTGPGGGAWTLRVADGACQVSEERAPEADLMISQSPEAFWKTMTGLADPMALMQSGEVKVQNMQNLPIFGALFPAG